MGGKAAKERRRLARLAANKGGGEEPASSPPVSDNKGTETSNSRNVEKKGNQTKQHNRFPRQSSQSSARQAAGDAGRRPAPNNSRFGMHARHDDKQQPRANAKAKPKKKPKVKKPKHLKRKLEKLSEEDDEERQRLVKEFNQFQALKSAMVKPAAKRQKSGPSNASEAGTEIRDDIVVGKKETMVKETLVGAAAAADTATEAKKPAIKAHKVAAISVSKKTPATGDGSDSDSYISLQDATKRQRGRRRRGRKSTDEQCKPAPKEPLLKDESIKLAVSAEGPKTTESISDPSKKTPKKDDKRQCIGRKPVTDFVIGQRYSGKVVYTKQFGAFIDIGCHSDAFCHVSRVKDDYVESIDDALNIGQEVSARVVEVDRKAKRITVSLQSDARIEDERASIEARRERKYKNGKGKHNSETTIVADASSLAPPPSPAKHDSVSSPPPLDESTMTPAELKRTRKLARRAARREQQAQTGLAA